MTTGREKAVLGAAAVLMALLAEVLTSTWLWVRAPLVEWVTPCTQSAAASLTFSNLGEYVSLRLPIWVTLIGSQAALFVAIRRVTRRSGPR